MTPAYRPVGRTASRRRVHAAHRGSELLDVKLRKPGDARGVDDGGGVLRTAYLERRVHPRLAHAEVEALALVLHLDEIGAGVGEDLEEANETARSVVDAGEDDQASP